MPNFDELKLQLNNLTSQIKFNDKLINAKLYLPINDKLELISWIINQSADELKFYNVGKLDVFKTIGIIKYYTDISLSEEEIQTKPTEIYDLLISSKLFDKIMTILPLTEIAWIDKVLMDTVDSIYKYQNSIFGILDAVTTDYQNLNFDVSELQKNISNPENLTLLKDVVTKLG